jgi:hypothetical protein
MTDLPQYPLLFFPKKQSADRDKKVGGADSKHYPTAVRQGERLQPKFTALQNAFGTIQQLASGVEPEQTLVFEIVGSVEDFAKAVKSIEGFDWLRESEIDEMCPDDDFYTNPKNEETGKQKRDEKNLGRKWYLVMSNSKAMNQLLSLWKKWRDGGDKKGFKLSEKKGLEKFKSVFKQLRDIRLWDAQDRLDETGVIEAWNADLELGDEVVSEIELWFRGSKERRNQASQSVRKLVENAGGKVGGECIIEEIAYHCLLVRLPRREAQRIINHKDTALVKCADVMFFSPKGQIVGFPTEDSDEIMKNADVDDEQLKQIPLPSGEPLIALLDGVPMTNHKLLAGRLRWDDPENFMGKYQVGEMCHGTAMASLIIHGDLESNEQAALKRPIYMRPVMQPDLISRRECIPSSNQLAIDLIHQAVRRMFERENELPAEAPSVKIINLSLGDESRQFVRNMSPWARLLDWLSAKYGVLFVVSAGNHSDGIEIALAAGEEVGKLSKSELETRLIKAIYSDIRNRRILSPAESINALTVGAVHSDFCRNVRVGVIDPLAHGMPSHISRFGPGYRKSVKPDLVFSGGRQTHTAPINSRLRTVNYSSGPGHKVAKPDPNHDMHHTRGTSNAAALVSRSAEICYDILQDIMTSSPTHHAEFKRCETALLKAMLVHGCEHGDDQRKTLNSALGFKGEEGKKALNKWLGYGQPNFGKVLTCNAQRATIIGFGELRSEEAHSFELPIPPQLESIMEERKITVTLAYISPIVQSNQRYRQTQLWFQIGNNKGDRWLTPDRKDCDEHSVKRGTVQHEIFVGNEARVFPSEKILVKVNCVDDAGKTTEPIAYGLIVSIEVKEGVSIPVYQEVKTRIAQVVQSPISIQS